MKINEPKASKEEMLNRLHSLDPIQYGKSRNFVDGAVTNLSPYISRGVIDTKEVLEHLVSKGFTYFQLEKFIQQLSWREYFQSVWQSNGEGINVDLKHDQHADQCEHASSGSTVVYAIVRSSIRIGDPPPTSWCF